GVSVQYPVGVRLIEQLPQRTRARRRRAPVRDREQRVMPERERARVFVTGVGTQIVLEPRVHPVAWARIVRIGRGTASSGGEAQFGGQRDEMPTHPDARCASFWKVDAVVAQAVRTAHPVPEVLEVAGRGGARILRGLVVARR